VVDDDDDACDLARLMLTSAGATVLCASCVDDAMDVVTRERPDVILTDLCLPRHGGYELRRWLERAGKPLSTIPCVAHSALDPAEEAAIAVDAGFVCYLPKPCKPDTLISTLATAVLDLRGVGV
jgi:CheY-like chemotaxis protein